MDIDTEAVATVTNFGGKTDGELRAFEEGLANGMAIAASKDATISALRKRVEELEGALMAESADAEKWRAFYSSARFTMAGSANLDHSAYPKVSVKSGISPRDWVHFGLEVWDRHHAEEDEQAIHGRNVLDTYVAHMIASRARAKGGEHGDA